MEHDPLLLLRNSILNKQPLPIPSKDEDPATGADTTLSLSEANYLHFNTQSAQDGPHHIALPLTHPTRFVSPSSGHKALDLRSAYLCWLHRDSNAAQYIADCTKISDELRLAGKEEKATNLVFAERLDLNGWLNGQIGESESEFIMSADGGRLKGAGKTGLDDIEMGDVGGVDREAERQEQERLQEIYRGERVLMNHNTVLRGLKPQDFSDLRKKYSPLFLDRSRQAAPQATAPAATNGGIRPPVKPAANRRPEPIILLSPSASSLLRMSNIKSFLEEGRYIPPETGTSGANILHLMRTLPSISGSKPVRFILVDDPSTFRPDYWDRLVAVFTTGQMWQFKNYKWQQPGDLFSHALGIYVGWKSEVVPETIKGWGRGVMVAQIDKVIPGQPRWRDREVVEEVWRGIEERMRAMGWGRERRAA
ncbi:CDC73-domain-containing protein [Piedraia hortae CBS 480.64]|uniref:CDC73-domain-containing protein n=1 Tax=Piedraia hortae CBS 480.64 TaxID=1314780 RepID=A0A6A7CA74_9PEZI|nr:CDC73-domain-containing protein [Piedraia hortae CBS 480.64]